MLLKILLQGPAVFQRDLARAADEEGPWKAASVVMSQTMLVCSSNSSGSSMRNFLILPTANTPTLHNGAA
jgi:hypothetical protein